MEHAHLVQIICRYRYTVLMQVKVSLDSFLSMDVLLYLAVPILCRTIC